MATRKDQAYFIDGELEPRRRGFPIKCPLCARRYYRQKMGSKRPCPECEGDPIKAQFVLIDREVRKNDHHLELLRTKMQGKKLTEAEAKFVEDWMIRRSEVIRKSVEASERIRLAKTEPTRQIVLREVRKA